MKEVQEFEEEVESDDDETAPKSGGFISNLYGKFVGRAEEEPKKKKAKVLYESEDDSSKEETESPPPWPRSVPLLSLRRKHLVSPIFLCQQ